MHNWQKMASVLESIVFLFFFLFVCSYIVERELIDISITGWDWQQLELLGWTCFVFSFSHFLLLSPLLLLFLCYLRERPTLLYLQIYAFITCPSKTRVMNFFQYQYKPKSKAFFFQTKTSPLVLCGSDCRIRTEGNVFHRRIQHHSHHTPVQHWWCCFLCWDFTIMGMLLSLLPKVMQLI